MLGDQALAIGDKIKELGRHAVLYGLGSVVQSASGLILLPLLTSTLAPKDFGAYSLVLLASSIASSVFYFGMTSALPRSYFDCGSDDDRRAVFTTAFLILSLGALLQILTAIFLNEELSLMLTGTLLYADAVYYAFIGSAIGFMNYYFISYLRLLRKATASVLLSIILLVITISITYYLLLKNPGSINEPFKAILYAQLIISLLFMIAYGKSAFILRVAGNEIVKLLQFGLPIILASFGGLLLDGMDRFIIENYIGLTEVGEYSVALRIASVINVILISPFALIWTPIIMEFRSSSNLNKLFSHVLTIYLIVGGIIVITMSLFANNIFNILVKSEIKSEILILFVMLLISQLVYSTTNFFSAGLYFERKVKIIPIIFMGVAITKFPVSLLLVLNFGYIGAGISSVLSCVAVPCIIYLVSKKYFMFNIEWKKLTNLCLIILPSILYISYAGINEFLGIFLKLIFLLLSLLSIFKICLSYSEKKTILNFIKKTANWRLIFAFKK